MEFDLLQLSIGFGVGLLTGIATMLIFNKVRSGSVSAVGVKQEFDDYKNQVEEHFEQTSKKFQNMTEQYQDLYEHLSVGATSLCASGSVAAALADKSDSVKPKQLESQGESNESEPQASTDETATANSEQDAKQNVSNDAVQSDSTDSEAMEANDEIENPESAEGQPKETDKTAT